MLKRSTFVTLNYTKYFVLLFLQCNDDFMDSFGGEVQCVVRVVLRSQDSSGKCRKYLNNVQLNNTKLSHQYVVSAKKNSRSHSLSFAPVFHNKINEM